VTDQNQVQRSEGYLVNPDEWTEDIARDIADEEGVELGKETWMALRFIRSYYEEHGIIPDIRHLVTFIAASLHCDKKTAKKMVFDMFPYGYVQQACKIAGMQKPLAWSTG